MPYVVRHYPSLEIAETTYSGLVTLADLLRATTEKVVFQRQHGVTRFLVTLGNSEFKVTPAEFETLLDDHFWSSEVSRASQIAIIQPSSRSALDAANYFIGACRKRGWKADLFPDRNAAMNWLSPGGRGRP